MATIKEIAGLLAGNWRSSSEFTANIVLERKYDDYLQATNINGNSWTLANGPLVLKNGAYTIRMGHNNGHTVDGKFASDLSSIAWSNGTFWARTESALADPDNQIANRLCGAWTSGDEDLLIFTKDWAFCNSENNYPLPPNECLVFDPLKKHWKYAQLSLSRHWVSGEFDSSGQSLSATLSTDQKRLSWGNDTQWWRVT